MADKTAIEWTDATWNPITGCSVVSAGCKHCYAMKLAGTRLKRHPTREGLTVDTAAGPVWNGEVRLNWTQLGLPATWKRARKIFVCAHGDLFHESVPDDWIDMVFAVMAQNPQHTFQVLTKRAARMRQYLSARDRLEDIYAAWTSTSGKPAEAQAWPLPNVWLGVSVENQDNYHRVHELQRTPAAVRWVSAEPLLGPIKFSPYALLAQHCFVCKAEDACGEERGAWSHPINCVQRTKHNGSDMTPGKGIGWVVVGGESGPGARPMHPDWARSIRDQCEQEGTPFLFKQWGAYAPNDERGDRIFVYHDGMTDIPDDRWPDPAFNGETHMAPMGKKAAGRLLDGQLHDGYPA